MEQDLEIKKNGDFNNLYLKPKPKDGIKGLENGNHIVVGKVFKDGLAKEGKFGTFYIMRVNYKGEECSFILNEKEHKLFSECGDIGDNIKITFYKEEFTNRATGIESLLPKLKFEKV